jgi:hypothetical protein
LRYPINSINTPREIDYLLEGFKVNSFAFYRRSATEDLKQLGDIDSMTDGSKLRFLPKVSPLQLHRR